MAAFDTLSDVAVDGPTRPPQRALGARHRRKRLLRQLR